MAKIHNIDTHEKDQVLDLLLYVMGPETRGRLMTELPIAYAKLFPTAKQAVIEHVQTAIDALHP